MPRSWIPLCLLLALQAQALAQGAREKCPKDQFPQGCGFTVWMGDANGNPLPASWFEPVSWEVTRSGTGPDGRFQKRTWKGDGAFPEGGIPGSGVGTRVITPEFLEHYRNIRDGKVETTHTTRSSGGGSLQTESRLHSRLMRAFRKGGGSSASKPAQARRGLRVKPREVPEQEPVEETAGPFSIGKRRR